MSRPQAPAMRWPAPAVAQPAPERQEIGSRTAFVQASPSAAQTTGKPATASPARGSHRRSLEKLTHSYVGPVKDRIGIDSGQFDRFGVISPKSLPKRLNGGCEIDIRLRVRGFRIMRPALKKEASRKPRVNTRRLELEISTRWSNGGLVP